MSARTELVDFLVQYGGRCRDCADENGFCPQTGIGCGQRRKAVEFILDALSYGSKHGYTAGFRILGPGEVAALQKALTTAEDHAGSLPAREAVKLRPADWHALAAAIRSLKGGRNA